ncbi:MAG: acyl--CoA ligase [Magnetococcus sp. YQC-9]
MRPHPLDFLARMLPENGARPALIDGERTWSYAALAHWVACVAQRLSDRGVGAGERLAIDLPNGAEFVVAYLAAWHAGITVIPINGAMPAEDRAYLLDLTRPTLRLDSTQEGLLEDSERGVAAPFTPYDERIPGAIFFTSGTTSRPKGVCHDAQRMLANVDAFNTLTGISAETRMLHLMPMGYMAGFLNTILSPLAAGGTVVLSPPFSSAAAMGLWPLAMKHRVNTLWLSPTMAAFLVQLNRGGVVYDWCRHHLTHVFIGTASLSAKLEAQFSAAFGVACLESYGMTELLLVSSRTPGAADQAGSVGRVLPGIECVMEENGQLAGVLRIRSPYAMLGYLDSDPAETGVLLPADAQGLETGDIGRLEGDRLFITGRKKDLILHGGVNVSPRAVEEVLLRHAEVANAAVVGMPHDFWGEEVVACVIAHDPNRTGKLRAELVELCRAHLSPDAVPGRFRFVESFPLSSTGKVRKDLLRQSD